MTMKDEPIIIEAKIFNLIPDKPNSNGRIYPKEILAQMVEKINKGEVFFHSKAPEYDGSPSVGTVIGEVSNAELKEDGIWVKVTQIDTPMSFIMGLYSKGLQLPIVPVSIGDINGNDMKITSADLIALYVGPANDPAIRAEKKQ